MSSKEPSRLWCVDCGREAVAACKDAQHEIRDAARQGERQGTLGRLVEMQGLQGELTGALRELRTEAGLQQERCAWQQRQRQLDLRECTRGLRGLGAAKKRHAHCTQQWDQLARKAERLLRRREDIEQDLELLRSDRRVRVAVGGPGGVEDWGAEVTVSLREHPTLRLALVLLQQHGLVHLQPDAGVIRELPGLSEEQSAVKQEEASFVEVALKQEVAVKQEASLVSQDLAVSGIELHPTSQELQEMSQLARANMSPVVADVVQEPALAAAESSVQRVATSTPQRLSMHHQLFSSSPQGVAVTDRIVTVTPQRVTVVTRESVTATARLGQEADLKPDRKHMAVACAPVRPYGYWQDSGNQVVLHLETIRAPHGQKSKEKWCVLQEVGVRALRRLHCEEDADWALAVLGVHARSLREVELVRPAREHMVALTRLPELDCLVLESEQGDACDRLPGSWMSRGLRSLRLRYLSPGSVLRLLDAHGLTLEHLELLVSHFWPPPDDVLSAWRVPLHQRRLELLEYGCLNPMTCPQLLKSLRALMDPRCFVRCGYCHV